MADWGGLENRCGLWTTVGSNPTLSACEKGDGVISKFLLQAGKSIHLSSLYLGMELLGKS